MIELKNVTMTYVLEQERIDVLKEVSLTIESGDSIAIVGPSGSGKTTLLLLLAGLEQPAAGTIEFDGTALSDLESDAMADLRRDRVGIIFQSFHLVGSLTALDNVALPLETVNRSVADLRGEWWTEGAHDAPNVVTVRTASLLETARELLGKAVAGLAVIALVSLIVSLLVLTGVMATSRARQIYDATILHSLGARLSVIKQSLNMEYLMLALVTSAFAIVTGSAIAIALLIYRLKLPAVDYSLWVGAITALGVSAVCLYLGGRYMLRRLHLNPALLLRTGG